MPCRKTSQPLPKIRTLNGAVCAQYKRCGKGNCKCTRGELHGPYFYRFQWYRGRMIKEYVRLADVEAIRAACARYRKLQADLRRQNQIFELAMSMLHLNLKEFGL